MATVLVILGLLMFMVLLNVFTLGLPRFFVSQRQSFKNNERQQLAMQSGWQFRPSAPELTLHYRCHPFTSRGDRRTVFGVVTGMIDNLPFTMLDLQLRVKRTFYGPILFEETSVFTVWLVKLPVVLPSARAERGGGLIFGPRPVDPQSADPWFNQSFKIMEGDAGLVNQLVTPQVAQVLRDYDIKNFTTYGDELVVSLHNTFTRTTAQELITELRKLVPLVHALPRDVLNRVGSPAPAPQPGYGQQPYPAPPPQIEAQYSPPQPAYPAPQYPPGYAPQPGYPPQQPGYQAQPGPYPPAPPQYPGQYPPRQY